MMTVNSMSQIDCKGNLSRYQPVRSWNCTCNEEALMPEWTERIGVLLYRILSVGAPFQGRISGRNILSVQQSVNGSQSSVELERQRQ